jgi:3-oxoacyl-[acyl-carrier protein] reductase
MELEGKIALVTGAASSTGIGRATALLMAERGASLALADIDALALAPVAAACEERGARTLRIEADQRQSADVERMIESARAYFGRIDILANIAAIYPNAMIEKTTDDLWDNVIQTNLTGVFYCCRAVLPVMRAQESGAIINIASGAAVRPLAGLAAYSASKGGIIAFSRVLAFEAAPSIRVNVVAPGPTATRGQPLSPLAPGMEDLIMGRQGKPEEIAEVICFLASDRASFVTGQVYHANGGRFMP